MLLSLVSSSLPPVLSLGSRNTNIGVSHHLTRRDGREGEERTEETEGENERRGRDGGSKRREERRRDEKKGQGREEGAGERELRRDEMSWKHNVEREGGGSGERGEM